jgi:hypothetical protein
VSTMPRMGEFRNASLASGEHDHLIGALDGASIAEGATLWSREPSRAQ